MARADLKRSTGKADARAQLLLSRSGVPSACLTSITLFAVANTAVVNYVTASRLIYGMARQRLRAP